MQYAIANLAIMYVAYIVAMITTQVPPLIDTWLEIDLACTCPLSLKVLHNTC